MIWSEIKEFFADEGIELYGAIPLALCKIINSRLIMRANINSDKFSVIMFAVPYLSRKSFTEKSNFYKSGSISVYAASDDYHAYFKELFGRFDRKIGHIFPDYSFIGFSDHSPIDEVNAAAQSGIGVIGDNGLLITKKYSSFVFLGEIITDAEIDIDVQKISFCHHCGNCKKVCPTSSIGANEEIKNKTCLSAVTQKKKDLSEDESKIICDCGSAWGCDACQFSCPITLNAVEKDTIFTDIKWFTENTKITYTSEEIEKMPEPEFSKKAFSWRGKNTILRNIQLIENSNTKL